MNWGVMKILLVVGCRVSISDSNQYDTSRPLIVVSNHQSMYDIPMFTWHFRDFGIRFVSKIELASGVPSVSYNLRHASHILIKRQDRGQAMERSKDGRPKRFSQNGLRLLVENMPDALIVPVTINGSWKLSRNGLFPIPFGVKATWEVHPIIDPAGMDFENLSSEIEKKIKSSIVEKEEAT